MEYGSTPNDRLIGKGNYLTSDILLIIRVLDDSNPARIIKELIINLINIFTLSNNHRMKTNFDPT